MWRTIATVGISSARAAVASRRTAAVLYGVAAVTGPVASQPVAQLPVPAAPVAGVAPRRGYASARETLSAPLDTFARRHIGPNETAASDMLKSLGLSSMKDLNAKVIPENIRFNAEFELRGSPGARGESDALAELRRISLRNQVYRSYIGTGYYNTKLPPVIQRNVLENPNWYTPYTPYQAEISQGRMESLLNYQTMVADLTGMAFSNASLLDEGTAAAEAMTLCVNHAESKSNRFFVSDKVHPQTLGVIQTRATPMDIQVIVGDPFTFDFAANPVSGALLQYPDTFGNVRDIGSVVTQLHGIGALAVVATDLLALTLLKPPGEFGADIAVGSAQRFGVPLGAGGPHAAFFAVNNQKLVRKIPGRIIGLSVDAQGNPAARLSLQTREQHIRREKATSNICTAQALLANMAAMYAIYHGPEGLKEIATRVHLLTSTLAEGLRLQGHTVSPPPFFDTITLSPAASVSNSTIASRAASKKINLRNIDNKTFGVSLDETTTVADVDDLLSIFAPEGSSISTSNITPTNHVAASSFARTSEILTHPVFHKYRSEHDMLRYVQKLQRRDLALTHSMIPLGSCTMKLNATAEMMPVTWPEISNIHPFAPETQTEGYQQIYSDLCDYLSTVTGFPAVSLQPNSGAQGEYTGLLVIRRFLQERGQGHRNICLIPSSAHGTNPASAAMAGMRVVVVECTAEGYINTDDLRAKAEKHKDQLAALMITYPSTFGVFEETVKDSCALIHKLGGQVYLDGANLNALVGLVRPSDIGADVCHMNLHKTFCIPHGGGGPGVGPIAVASHLAPFLPNHFVIDKKDGLSVGPVCSAPFGSSAILPITWMYMKMMGGEGLRSATQQAILNANYMRKRLEAHYPVRYVSKSGFCAHEFIIDAKPFKETSGIEVEDIAKRLMDYGFHSPTMSWPVPGTLMIEPTESETKEELDRFCDALIAIRQEIRDIEDGKQPRDNNLLKNAPHTARVAMADSWNKPYSREQAVFPKAWVRDNKYWPTVGRVDNVYGDRNLVCSCAPMENYEE